MTRAFLHHLAAATVILVLPYGAPAQNSPTSDDKSAALKRAISARSTLVVIYSPPTSTGYVFAAGGVAGGGDGFLAISFKKTGETIGAAAPVGGSFWAFSSDAVSSLNGLTLRFKDGVRVVVGHVVGTLVEGHPRAVVESSEHPEIARKLLAISNGDGAFRTDCFKDWCLNGIVGTAGGTLKLV